jgi:predicted DCC family thiol-disulfide oxidoreductase YuxK
MIVMPTPPTIHFIYDGECPLCQTAATYYKIRQAVGRLTLVDARTEPAHPVMQEINAAKLNLDEGMVIKYAGRFYQGNEALHLMSELGADTGVFNKINNAVFKSKPRADALYPFLKAGRNIALKLKGKGKIDNLKS